MRGAGPPNRRRAPAGGAALLALLAGGAACRRSAPPSPLERSITDGVRRALGAAKVSARCDRATPPACQAVADGATLRIAVEPDGLRWRLADPVIATAPLRADLDAELAALGVAAAADCGPAYVVAATGDVVACTLGTGGQAWARILADGRYVLDVALDRAEVEARVAGDEPAALLGQSTALDTDEAAGTEADGADDDAPDGSAGSGSGSAAAP